MDWYNDYNFVDLLLNCVAPFVIIFAGVVVGALFIHYLDVKWERDFKKEKEEYEKSETHKIAEEIDEKLRFRDYKQRIAESNWIHYWHNNGPYV